MKIIRSRRVPASLKMPVSIPVPALKLPRTMSFHCPEIIIVVLYFIYCVIHTCSATEFAQVIPKFATLGKLCDYGVIMGLLCTYLMYGKIRMKAGLGICVSAVLTLFAAKFGHSMTESVMLMLFMLCGIKLKSDLMMQMFFRVTTFLVAVTALFSIVGIFHMDIAINEGRVPRYYFGFTFTTYVANYFFHLLFVYFYLRQKIEFKDTVIIMILNYLIYKYTDTRAVFYGVILMVAVLWLSQWKPKLFSLKLFGIGCTLFMPFMAGLMLWLCVSYTLRNRTLANLNEALSGRLELGHRAIQKYGYPLFGTDVQWVTGRAGFERTKEYFYVDSSYINGMVTLGVVIMVIMILGFSLMSWKAYKNKNTFLCIILLFLAIHGFTDPQLISLKYNPFLLLLGKVFLTGDDIQLDGKIKNISDYIQQILRKWKKAA